MTWANFSKSLLIVIITMPTMIIIIFTIIAMIIVVIMINSGRREGERTFGRALKVSRRWRGGRTKKMGPKGGAPKGVGSRRVWAPKGVGPCGAQKRFILATFQW